MNSRLLILMFALVVITMQNAQAQFCTATTNLTASSGTFSDGSGTGNYADTTNCSWLIQPNGATSITINILSIDLQACCDTLIIYDGANSAAPILGTYSGTIAPPTINATGGSVFVRFITNGDAITGAGWNITYSSCGPPNIIANPSDVCTGGTAQINILSGSLIENFDPIVAGQWTIVGGAVDVVCGSVSGNALYFNGAGTRSATTNNLNVLTGGTIDFYLNISNGTTPCEMADAGEEVVLEYSIDNGLTWVIINTYATGGVYAAFTAVSEIIPSGAQTNATMFRWRQISNSGSTFDNWSLDDIQINSASNNYTYLWTPAAGLSNTTIPNPTATVNATTTYTVAVSSPNCNSTGTITINVVSPTPATITASDSTIFCQGFNTTLSANPGNSYLWSNGATTQSITVDTAGTFSVTVDYGYACVATSPNTIIVVNPLPAIPTVTAASAPEICNGTSVVINSSTAANLTYQWNKFGVPLAGATSSSFTAITGGNYGVTVTDNNNCSSTSTTFATITDLTPIITVSATPTPICAGGTVQLNVLSSVLTQNFDPLDTNQLHVVGGIEAVTCGSVTGNALYFDGTLERTATTNNMNVTAGGTISFYLKISDGLTPCEQADLGEEVVLQYSVDGGITWVTISTYAVGTAGPFANFAQVNEIIPGPAQTSSTKFRWAQPSNTGIGYDNWALDDVQIIGSNGTYSYLWNSAPGLSSDTIADPTVVATSSTYYTVTVTNSGVCSISANAIVTTFDAFNITETHTDAACDTCCNGTANINVTGGTPIYTYVWNPAPLTGQGTDYVTGLCDGTYTVTVSDTTGCSNSLTINIGDLSGFEELGNLKNISLFPNPTLGKFTLTKNNTIAEKLKVSITNVLGDELIIDELPSNVTIKEYNIETLSTGIYFVKVQSPTGNAKVIKLVKN
jgi:hypothetical protein